MVTRAYSAIQAGVQDLFPGYFAVVMATGIISIAAHLLNMEVIASDPYVAPEVFAQMGVASVSLDELAQREVINTGVILAPNARFYPVSLDRFITEVLDQEFRP